MLGSVLINISGTLYRHHFPFRKVVYAKDTGPKVRTSKKWVGPIKNLL